MRNLATLLFVLLTATHVAGADWHDISVKFRLKGKRPDPVPIVLGGQRFCRGKKLTKENLVVNKANGGIQNVVMFLYPRKDETVPIHAQYKDQTKSDVDIKTSCRFEPRIVCVRTGQDLVMRNRDPIVYNPDFEFYVNERVNPFIPPNTGFALTIRKEERLPVRVSDSIRYWMVAWLVVRDLPYMSVSDANGNLTIRHVPAGRWRFRIWHESADDLSSATIGKRGKILRRGCLDIKIDKSDVDLGIASIPVSAFEKPKK